jgi:hypothetical protein
MPPGAPGSSRGSQGADSLQLAIRNRQTNVAPILAPIQTTSHTAWAMNRRGAKSRYEHENVATATRAGRIFLQPKSVFRIAAEDLERNCNFAITLSAHAPGGTCPPEPEKHHIKRANVAELDRVLSIGVENAMCDECNKIDAKLTRYRKLSRAVTDTVALESIDMLIADLEFQKSRLHPKPEDRAD